MTTADARKIRDYLDAVKAIPRPRLQSGEAGEKVEGIRLKALADLNLLATEGEADIAETLTVKRGGIPFAFVSENPTAPEFVSIWRRP
jgi:hypothetical protein